MGFLRMSTFLKSCLMTVFGCAEQDLWHGEDGIVLLDDSEQADPIFCCPSGPWIDITVYLPHSDFVLLQNINLWHLPKGSMPGSSGQALVGPVTCPVFTSRTLPHCGCHLFSCLTEEVVQIGFYTWQFKFRSMY